MSLPPRGSARWFNLAFETALERGKEQIDYALNVLDQPPLTVPLTLAKLRKMDPEDAVAELQEELRRTMKIDEVTQEPIPDNDTLKLYYEYIASTQEVPE